MHSIACYISDQAGSRTARIYLQIFNNSHWENGWYTSEFQLHTHLSPLARSLDLFTLETSQTVLTVHLIRRMDLNKQGIVDGFPNSLPLSLSKFLISFKNKTEKFLKIC